MIRTITLFFFIVATASIKTKAQLPNGFVDQLHSDGWQSPTGLTFDASGKMYVSEKEGKVYVVENGIKTLFIDISEEVGNYGDYGLLNFVLDPNFMNNGHVYLYYIVDRYYLFHQGEAIYDQPGATIARVTRYTVPDPAMPNSVKDGSRLVLIGESHSTGFPMTGTNHGGGGMVFANDGTLFVSCGDGGLGDDADNYDNQAFNDGIISQDEYLDDRVYRCQIINSLNGKVIRIDPATGNGISGNPYFDANSPRSAQSRVWALGFRNPFRITIKPNSGNPGVLYVGEVGWNVREELNIITSGGQNFGWPIYEGIDLPTVWTNPLYTPSSYNRPIVEWSHHYDGEPDASAKVIINGMVNEVGSYVFPGNSFTGYCSIGGVWYTGTTFPEEFRNTYIFADFVSGWIKSFSFNNNENPTSFRDLTTSAIGAVSIAYNPIDESIYYLKLGFNEVDPIEVRRISYGTTNVRPIARFTYNPSSGTSPLPVSFNASTSTDYENTVLSYNWDFGDGSTGSGVNVSHVFDNGSTNPQKYKITLTVTDEGGLTGTTSAFVSLNNTVPIINSTSIDAINVFANNNTDLIQLSAQVSDNEELSENLTYRWVVRLYHGVHSHPELDVTRMTSQINLPPVPCDGHLYFYRFILTVSDSYGLFTTFTKDIYPNCGSDITPPGQPQIKSFDNTGNSFKLSWNGVYDNVGVASYEVFINGVFKELLSAQTLSYQYTSLTSIENEAFECYVKVKDFAGKENVSSKLNFIHKTVPSIGAASSEYLSNLIPISSANGHGPIEIDHSNGQEVANDGNSLILNGTTYGKGIGVHANSEIIYSIPSNTYNTFGVKIGIDDEIPDSTCGSVIFKIFKDDVLTYQSPTMFPSTATIDVQVDITNATQLRLVVEEVEDNTFCDHADWADAKLFTLNTVDIEPPTNPSLTYIQSADHFQIQWGASTDNKDTNLDYEIMIDNILNSNTNILQSILPTLVSGNHVITIQAKDDAGNRAVSNSITLTYAPCPSSMELLPVSDNFSNSTITLKSLDFIKASNTISNAKVIYQAGSKIELLPGFSATAGSVFTAQIHGCDN